jgi:hypothetical protein
MTPDLPWDYVTRLCARSVKKSGQRQFVVRLMIYRATVVEESRNGLVQRVEAVLHQLHQGELDFLAATPDAQQRKPWDREGNRYVIDMSHLHRKHPATRQIRTWAEAIPGGGARFVSERMQVSAANRE